MNMPLPQGILSADTVTIGKIVQSQVGGGVCDQAVFFLFFFNCRKVKSPTWLCCLAGLPESEDWLDRVTDPWAGRTVHVFVCQVCIKQVGRGSA